ncbi:hypothetical protein Z945_3851 [Sulfitobacter noctilucae]|nr:hypothetical protein Z945_3851 [Sulfitobacter noctilucae]
MGAERPAEDSNASSVSPDDKLPDHISIGGLVSGKAASSIRREGSSGAQAIVSDLGTAFSKGISG